MLIRHRDKAVGISMGRVGKQHGHVLGVVTGLVLISELAPMAIDG